MDTIAARIKKLREALKISKADLARKVGVNRASVTYWENGSNAPNSEYMLKLALILKTTPEYILFGGKISNVKKILNYSKGRIPLMTLSTLKQFLNKEFLVTDFVETKEGEEKNKFCISVEGDSMISQTNPSFSEGSQIVVDTIRKEKLGDFVIAQIIDTDIFIFRKLTYDVDNTILQALNPLYKSLKLDHKIKIIGVVIEHRNLF